MLFKGKKAVGVPLQEYERKTEQYATPVGIK